ncbi:MAG: hypothetical protein ABIP75_04310 [Pyrinomonadaceae bacterium]
MPSFPQVNHRFWICAGIFVMLVGWLLIWPYTGDGDSMLHYWNLRHSFGDPRQGLTSWARPLFVLTMMFPARGGVFAVRCFAALLTTILTWQTMRLADDLEIPRATMAGPLLIFQPLVFALASDTMTELPMALGTVIALRLWFARKYAFSCLVVSFLPLLRPEGFFIAPFWGLFLLFLPLRTGFPKLLARLGIGTLLATGMICQIAVCYWVTNDGLYFIHAWSWPAYMPSYVGGSFWHHFIRWPGYCGWILFPLFVLGIRPSLNRKMALPWVIWGVVFMTHTILFWRGAFGAIGLMRILASTSPVTAVIMLYGWNFLLGIEWVQRLRPVWHRLLPVALVLAAAATAMVYYYADAVHHRCFGARQAANYVRQNNLTADAPRFFVGDPMVLAALDYPDFDERLVINRFDRLQLRQLADLPLGSIGVWDNQQGQMWHNVKPEELSDLGYTTLFTTSKSVRVYYLIDNLLPTGSWTMDIRFVVVRKDRAAK